MKSNYLSCVKKQFEYYKLLGDKTFEQLTEKELFWEYNQDNNSISIIVNHLWGNMLSRWTDFLTSDGEKTWRERDQEFEQVIRTKEDLTKKWNEGWECLFNALATINEDNFDTAIYIRNQSHTIVEAINRQMMHYAYHIGQVVYIGKMIRGKDWISLTIPKGGSVQYNSEKFSKGKHDGHFTEE